MFRYKGIKITSAWAHDDGRKIQAGWVEDVTPEQLADYDVTEVADIDPPDHDPQLQFVTEQPDGSYIISPLSSEQIRIKAKNILNNNLNSMIYTYGDGRIIQTRPNDLTNFQLTIAIGQDVEWVMADNTLSIMTTIELQEALDASIIRGGIYWDEYKDVIRGL